VRADEVHVDKETVVREEVNVGKRKVHETREVREPVRTETLKVEREGKTTVRDAHNQDRSE